MTIEIELFFAAHDAHRGGEPVRLEPPSRGRLRLGPTTPLQILLDLADIGLAKLPKEDRDFLQRWADGQHEARQRAIAHLQATKQAEVSYKAGRVAADVTCIDECGHQDVVLHASQPTASGDAGVRE